MRGSPRVKMTHAEDPSGGFLFHIPRKLPRMEIIPAVAVYQSHANYVALVLGQLLGRMHNEQPVTPLHLYIRLS